MSDSSSEEEEFQEGDNSSDDNEEESDEEEQGDDEDDDVPLSSLKKRRASSTKTTSYAEDDDDDEDEDDSDDDKPLAALLKDKKKTSTKAASSPPKKKKTSTPSSATKKKAAAAAAKPAAKKKAKKETSVSTSSSSSKSNKYEWSSAALYGTECDKGMLIQRLLCRWWYAMEWPETSSLPDQPPKHYDALDGFPGVYIGTSGEHVGTLLDKRDKAKAPSFANFSQKHSSELRDLLLKALKEQKKQLVEAEGTGTETEREIDQLVKWATKINPDKADKEAAKVLKAAGF